MAHELQVDEPSPFRRHACDICSYPSYIARLALCHNGLKCCFPCAFKQGKAYLKDAHVLCHEQFSEFEQIAVELRKGGLENAPAPAKQGVRYLDEELCQGSHLVPSNLGDKYFP